MLVTVFISLFIKFEKKIEQSAIHNILIFFFCCKLFVDYKNQTKIFRSLPIKIFL